MLILHYDNDVKEVVSSQPSVTWYKSTNQKIGIRTVYESWIINNQWHLPFYSHITTLTDAGFVIIHLFSLKQFGRILPVFLIAALATLGCFCFSLTHRCRFTGLWQSGSCLQGWRGSICYGEKKRDLRWKSTIFNGSWSFSILIFFADCPVFQ